MAYISAIDDEEEKQPGAAPQAVGASAPPIAGGTAPAAAPQPAASKFVNFSRYLNTSGGGSNSNIAGDIEKQGQAVQNDLAGAQAQFNQAVTAGRNPVTGYTGPNDLAASGAAWTGLQDRARAVQDSANATASPGGLGSLLQKQNPGAYSAGSRRLDTALTGYTNADALAQARERYGKLSDTLNQANNASVTTADAARTTTNDAKASAERAAETARIQNENAAAASARNQESSFWFGVTDPLVSSFGWNPSTVTGIRRGDTPTGEQMLDIVLGPKDFTGTRNSPIAKSMSESGKDRFAATWDKMTTQDKHRAAALTDPNRFMDFMSEMSAKYGLYRRPDGKVSVIGQRGSPTRKVSIVGQR